MIAALLALLISSHPLAECGKCERLAAAITEAADTYQIDPLLLASVALVESGGVWRTAWRPWGFAVGVFQLANVPSSTLKQNALEAAKRLREGHALCAAGKWPRICARGFWAVYNSGSRRWAKKVGDIYQGMRDDAKNVR